MLYLLALPVMLACALVVVAYTWEVIHPRLEDAPDHPDFV